MRDHSKHVELSREVAIATILANCRFSPKHERMTVADARGRVLAQNVCSKVDYPTKLTCNMDSVAFKWDEIEALVQGMEQEDAKAPDTSAWTRGQEWEFANTGVAMPDGYDTAIAIECAEVSKDESGCERITMLRWPQERFQGTTQPASNLHVGELLARAGTVLDPLVMASIIGGGILEVDVLSKPRVAFIPTGNELVAPTQEPPAGKRIDSNSTLIRAKIEQWGGEPVMYPIMRDEHDAIEQALREAAASCDIVVINGGSSKGSDDWTMEILEEIGTVFCHETNNRPGRHSAFALVEGTPIVGISGPPRGAAFTTDFYLKPLVRAYLGQEPAPQYAWARLMVDFEGNCYEPPAPAGRKPRPEGEPFTVIVPFGVVPKLGFVPLDRAGEYPQIPAEFVLDGGYEAAPDAPYKFEPGAAGEPARFFAIKAMHVRPGADGYLETWPCDWDEGAAELEAAAAYYSLPTGKDVLQPQAGDLILIELRGRDTLA